MARAVRPILAKTGKSVAAQYSKFSKLKKADDDDLDNFVDAVDLSLLDLLVDATPDQLAAVASDSGKQSLFQLGIEHRSGLVNQVNDDALAYARNRGAEMVGKKWIDGELVDNPDAKWVISDATRDELRGLIAQVQSGDLPMTDLRGAIEDAGAFSKQRAELIARTETQAANAQGSLAGYRTAKKIGVNVKKAWEVDDDPCPICIENGDAGAIDLEDDFPDGSDAPPSHVNCECVLVPITEADNENSDSESEEG